IAARLLLQVWFFAPMVGDALTYHLPKVAEWVGSGRMTRELGPDPRAAFPAGFELVEAWCCVFLHHDALIEMAGVEFLALAFAATYALGRRLGLEERPSVLAAFLYALTPGLHFQATGCMNDGPVAALIVGGGALLFLRLHLARIVIGAACA